MKLTSANGIDLPEGKNDAIIFDSALRGFAIRVRRLSGGRIDRNFILQYRAHGRSRRMIVGSTSVLTTAQAREKAKKLLAEVQLGGDPQGDRKAQREKDSLSLRGVISDFIEHKTKKVRPNTLTILKRYLATPYLGSLIGMPIDRITKRDIASRMFAVEKRGIQTAACFRGALSSLFVWAMEEGLTEHNPLIGTRKPVKSTPRDRVLSDDEIAKVWLALEDDDFGKIVKLLFCTACRRQEIGRMKWSEIDLDAGLWVLPKERSKTKKAHTLPITPLMANIFDTVPMREGNDFLFAKKGFSSWRSCKIELDKRIGLSQPWQLRDIRRSVSTRMNDLGIAPPHVIEKILNHSLGGSHGVYNKSDYRNEVRHAMALWSDHVRTLIEGGERKVVAFEQRAASTP
jgi:integrase